MKIWASSDLHINYSENKNFFYNLSASDYVDDVLIIAGDISHDLAEVSSLFRSLVPKFRKVLFVPGNHDVWIMPNENCQSSMLKHARLLQIAKEEGVSTEIYHIGAVSIIPLFAWYDFSFGLPTDTIRKAWRDFKRCKWEMNFRQLTEYFLQLNEQAIATPKQKYIISFSHFLPRLELIPNRVPPIVKALLPVFGAEGLGRQVAQLQSNVHIYGHSHLNRKVVLGKTVFINNAFAYPQEATISRKKLLCIYNDYL